MAIRRGRLCGIIQLLAIGSLLCLMLTAFLLTKTESKLQVQDAERRTVSVEAARLSVHKEKTTFDSIRRADATVCPSIDVLFSGEVNKLGQYPVKTTFLTIGIATIARKSTSYLLQTLKSLVGSLNENDKRDLYIVVFLADLTKEARRSQQESLTETLHDYVAKDILHVIEAPSEFYPPLDHLKQKYNDSAERTKWRSKQNIDYAFLMCYCNGLSSYYLHLEDDIKVAPSFFPKLRDFIKSQTQPWKGLDASRLGHIGKVYHSEDLSSAASLFYVMYDEMPVDWLMMYWRAITSHKPGKSQFLFHTASLFEHLGVQSSLKEKRTNHTEEYFDKYDHKYLGLNPAAKITSSLIPHKGEPQDAYVKGIGYFWVRTVQQGDSFQISFKSPVHVKEVSVETGSNLAPEDHLQFAHLQVSTDLGPCRRFTDVGKFVWGSIHVHIDQTVTCLRVMVFGSQDNWVFFREINVWTK